MKKLSVILVLLSVLFFSCSSPTIESIPEIYNSPAETAHTQTHTHTFKVQRLFYDESFALIINHTLRVKVSADGCTCTECGAKYHTNEVYSCYIDSRYRGGGSDLTKTLISIYRTMGYNKAQASILAEDTYNDVYGDLYRYYYSLGYEATSY